MSDQSGDCVEIEGSRGIVRDSTFAGCDDGVLDIEGNGMRVLDNNARAGDNLCMELEGDRARIQGNAVANCEDGGGIQLDGADAVIAGNAVRSTDGVGIDLIADGAVIRGNRLRNIEDNGLEIDGTGALIKSNRMSGSGGANDCFEVTGIRQRVVSNRANFCDGGFEVSGENMRVVGNRSVNSGDDAAFDIDCSDEPGGADAADACVNTVIEDNFGADNNNDDEGFEISDFTSDGGLLIRNNVSRDNNDGGFEIDVADSRIVGNTSLRDGAEGNEPGFEIDGDGNRIEKNFASGSGEDGLNVSGLEIVLVRNLVRQSHVDGIHVDSGATDAVLRKNLALGNFADGIENDGTDTDVIENEARGNRRDCVNDGTIDLKQGNRCADGSNFNQPGTVDRRRPRR